jgi:outer membrane receptor protein involved in Fe transport
MGPFNAFAQAYEQVRDNVANFHFGIPQKSGNKDDVQLLWDYEHISNYGYTSPNDQGGYPFLNAVGAAPFWFDTFQSQIPYGTLLPQTYTGGGVGQYPFPFSPSGRPLTNLATGPLVPEPDNNRDEYVNDQSIIKLQYQHNFGTSAFLRAYVYTYYSDWLNYGPNSTVSDFVAFDSPDYELNSHTRGGSLQFTDQITPEHLLTLNGSYTTANSVRYNNSFYGNQPGTAVGYLVNGNDPGSGVCYNPTAAGNVAVPGCNFSGAPFGYFTENQAFTNTVTPAAGTCGTGPCQYLVVGGGPSASYNTVIPKFTTFSVSDVFTPTAKLNINLGLRYDQFQFVGSSTQDTIARTLFFNAYNLVNPTTPLENVSNTIDTFDEWQPRLGATYTLNPTTVLRASYGRYAEAPNTAFEQYNYLQPNSTGPIQSFNNIGLGNTPGHDVRPEVSNNYDFSLEHQFSGDTSIKVSPFLRSTQDQIQQFYLDQKTSFVSGLNVGHQTSKGVEFELDKGDFSRNGLAAKLSFTYTYSTIKYDLAPNGTSVVTGINDLISQYNTWTKAGGGSPCYNPGPGPTAGAAVACAPGMIANPYYNAPAQGLLSQSASYPTFDLFPAGIGSEYDTYGAPYVTTLIVQYKHGPLAITPALQFSAGQRYGAPITTPGIDPTSCITTPTTPGVLPGTTAGDPRYPYGSAGGSPYNALACTNQVNGIPNPFTGSFDAIGGYIAPSALQLHLQVTYDLSKRVTLVANLANLVNTCFGGTKVPWSVSGACGYNVDEGAPVVEPYGNFYNPGQVLQPALKTPYFPFFPTFPFNMYVEARVKL